MHCEQTEMLLPLLVFDELDDAQKTELMAHLNQCAACSEKLGDMRVTLNLLREGVAAQPAPVFSELRRQKLMKKLAAKPRVKKRKVKRGPLVFPSWMMTIARYRRPIGIAAGLAVMMGVGASVLFNAASEAPRRDYAMAKDAGPRGEPVKDGIDAAHGVRYAGRGVGDQIERDASSMRPSESFGWREQPVTQWSRSERGGQDFSFQDPTPRMSLYNRQPNPGVTGSSPAIDGVVLEVDSTATTDRRYVTMGRRPALDDGPAPESLAETVRSKTVALSDTPSASNNWSYSGKADNGGALPSLSKAAGAARIDELGDLDRLSVAQGLGTHLGKAKDAPVKSESLRDTDGTVHHFRETIAPAVTTPAPAPVGVSSPRTPPTAEPSAPASGPMIGGGAKDGGRPVDGGLEWKQKSALKSEEKAKDADDLFFVAPGGSLPSRTYNKQARAGAGGGTAPAGGEPLERFGLDIPEPSGGPGEARYKKSGRQAEGEELAFQAKLGEEPPTVEFAVPPGKKSELGYLTPDVPFGDTNGRTSGGTKAGIPAKSDPSALPSLTQRPWGDADPLNSKLAAGGYGKGLGARDETRRVADPMGEGKNELKPGPDGFDGDNRTGVRGLNLGTLKSDAGGAAAPKPVVKDSKAGDSPDDTAAPVESKALAAAKLAVGSGSEGIEPLAEEAGKEKKGDKDRFKGTTYFNDNNADFHGTRADPLIITGATPVPGIVAKPAPNGGPVQASGAGPAGPAPADPSLFDAPSTKPVNPTDERMFALAARVNRGEDPKSGQGRGDELDRTKTPGNAHGFFRTLDGDESAASELDRKLNEVRGLESLTKKREQVEKPVDGRDAGEGNDDKPVGLRKENEKLEKEKMVAGRGGQRGPAYDFGLWAALKPNDGSGHLSALGDVPVIGQRPGDAAQPEAAGSDLESGRQRAPLPAENERGQSVQRLLQRAQELRSNQDYERSLQLVGQALFLDPNNAAAESLKLMIEDTQVATKSKGYQRLRDQRFAQHSMEMIEATIPYNELITYPAEWPQLTASRLGAIDNDGGTRQLNRRVTDKLQEPVPIEFKGDKLVNVVDYLREKTGVNYFVNWAALEAAGIGQDTPVSLQLNNVPADQALKLVLSQASGAATPEPAKFRVIDGVVHVSTQKDLDSVTDRRAYDTKEILAVTEDDEQSAVRVAQRQTEVGDLINTIKKELGKQDHEATFSIREIDGKLIVRGTEQDHQAITALLAKIGGNKTAANTDAVRSADAAKDDGAPLQPAATFRVVPVNPWTLTEQDAQSTFALDVDTAAYTLGRKYINRGYLPPAGSVRMEEYVNAFDYNYAAQCEGVFNIHAEAAPAPFAPRNGTNTTLLKVGVKGKVIGRDGRKPANLVFVVDTSGSMARADRLPMVQHSLELLTKQLTEHDTVSLVTFGSQVLTLLDGVRASEKDAIITAIRSLQPNGPTNLLKGVQAGYKVAQQMHKSGSINRIILCSDGIATLGETEAEAILSYVDQYRKQGISCTTIGFGAGAYDDDMMEKLANKGDGAYYFVDSKREAQRVFVDELTATLQSIAKDAKIQVEFNPQRVRRYRLIGYENRAVADKDFRNDTIDAGEVGSGQSSTALYEVELISGDAATNAADLGTVFVRYRNADTEKIEEISQRLGADLVRERSVKEAPRFYLAACAAEFAELLRDSEHAAGGSLSKLQDVMARVVEQLPLDERAAELLDLVRKAQGLPRAP
jgi:Ca-activated chloride channel family protein